MASAAEPNSDADGTGYRVDDVIIDVGSQRVMRGDQEIPMPQLSFQFLLALARAAPNVLSADQLMERVWPGLVVGPETISQRVKLVRDALGDDSQAPRYIGGVRGRGYRMLARVSRLPAPRSMPVAPDPTVVATSVNVTTATNVAAAAGAAIPSVVSVPAASPGTSASPPTFPPGGVKRRRTLAIIGAVAVVAIACITIAQYRGWLGFSPQIASTFNAPKTPRKTIAVLPLIDISPGGGNEYLGDGLAEELTDRLTRIPGVRVAARTSSFAFKGKPADVREIAQSLAVRHVLEGSVRREGDRLRVTAQLIDAESGYHIWSHSYDRKWKDLLDIQDEIARSIVDALQLVLSSEIIDRLEHAKTSSLEAFDLYLSGLAKLRDPGSPTQFEDAERIFQAALALDNRFARAHAGLCQTYAAAFDRSRDTAIAAKAEAACGKALALDSSLREVETALASLYLVSGRADRATEIYKNFIARNPADSDAYIGLAQAYERQGKLADAESTFRRSVDSEPSYGRPNMMFGHFLFKQGRAREAAEYYRRVTELQPASARAFSSLGGALQLSGDFEGAARALERSLELEPTAAAYTNTGTLYYYLGRLAEAEKVYGRATELSPRDHRMWANLGDALTQMPDRGEEARRQYEKAINLALEDLKVNAADPDTLAALAYYYARIGDHARAAQRGADAVKLGPGSIYVHYYVALVSLEAGHNDAALSELEIAVDLGYPRQLIRAGPEFAKLRSDPRFQRLVATNNRHSAG